MQSNAARIAVGVMAVAVIVVLFLVLAGDDEGDDGTTSTTDVAETTTVPGDSGGEGSEASKPERPPKPPEPEVETIEIEGGQPAGDPVELEFDKGEEVRFDVESDIDQELHIHGYDIYVDAKAGKTEEVSFPAEIDGIYEIESHDTGALLAELTVQP